MRSGSRSFAGVILLWASTACGGGGSDPKPPDAGGEGPDAAAATIDAAGPGTADAAASDPDAAPESNAEGLVIVGEVAVDGTPLSLANATFWQDGPFGGNVIGASGDCVLYDTPPQSGLSAGIGTVSGANQAFSFVPMGVSPDAQYGTQPTDLPLDLVNEGATISVSFNGTVVPAFSLSASVPDVVEGYTPPTVASRVNGIQFDWTAGQGDEIWIFVASFGQGPGIRVIACRVADTGSFTVPGAITSLIPMTDDQAARTLYRFNVDSVDTGVAPVTLLVGAGIAASPINWTP